MNIEELKKIVKDRKLEIIEDVIAKEYGDAWKSDKRDSVSVEARSIYSIMARHYCDMSQVEIGERIGRCRSDVSHLQTMARRQCSHDREYRYKVRRLDAIVMRRTQHVLHDTLTKANH